jgi:hypothetical protein
MMKVVYMEVRDAENVVNGVDDAAVVILDEKHYLQN